MTCSTGSVFAVSSDFNSPSASPFLIVWVYLVVLVPGWPWVTTSLLPASRVSSSMTLTVNGISSFTSWLNSPVKSFWPTLITALTGFVISTFASPTISEFLIVQVVFLVPSVPSTSMTYSPDFRFLSYEMSYLNGIFSSWVWVPSVFLPTLMIFLTGALVSVNSLTSIFVTLPSSIVRVVVLVFSPGTPSTSTFCSPGARLSSNWTSTSKGTSTFSSTLWVPSRVPLPTWIIASSAVSVVTVGSPSTIEFTIFHVVVLDPAFPGFIISYSPFLRLSTSLTVYPNGISSTCFTSPTKSLPPTSITAFSGLISSTLVSVTSEFSMV